MSETMVLQVSSKFPAGTSVGAYAGGPRNTGEAPGVSATDTVTVASDGTATFTALADGKYTVSAEISDVWKHIAFTAGEDDQETGATVSGPELEAHTASTAQIEDDAVTAPKIAAGAVGTSEVAADSLAAGDLGADSAAQSEIAADSVGDSELKLTLEDVTVAAGQPSGTATVVAGDKIIGIYPVSNQDQFVDSVVISGTTLTVTLAANATADNVFKVAVINA